MVFGFFFHKLEKQNDDSTTVKVYKNDSFD